MALLELCVEDLAGVEEARKNGISRVEICDDLSVGGLTPRLDFVEKSLAVGDTDVMVLVRPRAGDFIHTPAEVEQILHSIREISALPNPTGVQLGFVVGALNEDLTVNEDAAIAFREATGDKPLTFHRAFDETPDLFKTIDQLKSWGYQRALTTGGNGPKADADSLRALQERPVTTLRSSCAVVCVHTTSLKFCVKPAPARLTCVHPARMAAQILTK